MVAITNDAGTVVDRYLRMTPYGVTTETRYTGQYQDTTTGLYKMGARYYQPELGRWTQRDPSGQEANAYAYVGGNPVNFTDRTGLLSLRDVVQIAAALTASVERLSSPARSSQGLP